MEQDFTEEQLDAAREIRRVLDEFGLSDEELRSVLEVGDPPWTERELLSAIVQYGVESYVHKPEYVVDNKGLITHGILLERPRIVNQDYGYQERDLLPTALLSEVGYDLDAELYDGTELVSVTFNSHPEAFWLIFADRETGERTRFPFRYPPGNERWAPNNEKALFHAINQEFLMAEGYRFLEVNTYADYLAYFLMETDRVADLRRKYGDAIEVFGFEMCHEESLRERALRDYDPDGFKDHEATYGKPEPEGTVTVTPE